MYYKSVIILACLYGIIKEFHPATPFLTPYLISPVKNFTKEDLYAKIYPYWTYSYLLALIPVFFLTDILRYKPVVCLEALSLCGTWALLVWGTTVQQMQLMQILFGVGSASGIAYFSYMYAAVDEKDYKRITSFTRSAVLIGKFISYGSAQVLVNYFGHSRYLLLNQISFAGLCVTVIIAFLLPKISSANTNAKLQYQTKQQQSLSINASSSTVNELTAEGAKFLSQPPTAQNGIALYFKEIWANFQIYCSDIFVLKWSLWWALTSSAVFQVQNYMQILWATMQRTDKDVQNGVSECFNTLIGALLSYLIQYWAIDWEATGEYVLLISSLLSTALLFLVANTTNIYVAYVIYSIIVADYHTLTTAASANIASHLNKSSYGLVLGWNTFVALILQTILTVAVADQHGFNLDIRTQFIVYAYYFGAITILFAGIVTYKVIIFWRQRSSNRTVTEAQMTA